MIPRIFLAIMSVKIGQDDPAMTAYSPKRDPAQAKALELT
jgi:hypothetical protein